MTDAERIDRIWNERARAMTVIHLTRRQDLALEPGPRKSGLDMLLRWQRGDDDSTTLLGVLIRWAADPVPPEEAQRLAGDLSAVPGAGLPSLALFFTQLQDRAYLAWLDEPAGAGLVRHARPAFVPFTQELLAGMVDRAAAWHDARRPVAVA
ncbi:MAG: hypothetical protein K2W96_15265 [Gemmataceae bacterium]|nr:hypothetical protein [Gemmataceae bacterium]